MSQCHSSADHARLIRRINFAGGCGGSHGNVEEDEEERIVDAMEELNENYFDLIGQGANVNRGALCTRLLVGLGLKAAEKVWKNECELKVMFVRMR